MTISLAKININSDKWIAVFNKFNDVVDAIDTKVVTVDADITNGNCTIGGRLIANEIFEGSNRVVNSSLNISTGTGLSGGGNLSTNRTISLSSATLARLAKADSALQTADFNGKLGLKTKISVPGDILAAGIANSTTFLSGVGTWVKLDNTPGDMLKLIYDPWSKQGNAFDMSYMVESNQHKVFTAVERTKLAATDGKFADINNDIVSIKNQYVKRDGSLSITGGIQTSNITMNGKLITNQEIQTTGISSSAKVNITAGGLEVAGNSLFKNTTTFNNTSTFKGNIINEGNLTMPSGRINLLPTTPSYPADGKGTVEGYFYNRVNYTFSGSETDNSDIWGSMFILKNLTTNREGRFIHTTKKTSNVLQDASNDRILVRIDANSVAYFQGNGEFWIKETCNANTIYSRNDVGAASDIKLKDNLEIIPEALSKLKLINGYTYNRIDSNDSRRHAGLIAQEVEKILPEVVGSHDDTKFIKYGNLVALLVEAVKELSNEVEILKQRIK